MVEWMLLCLGVALYFHLRRDKPPKKVVEPVKSKWSKYFID